MDIQLPHQPLVLAGLEVVRQLVVWAKRHSMAAVVAAERAERSLKVLKAATL